MAVVKEVATMAMATMVGAKSTKAFFLLLIILVKCDLSFLELTTTKATLTGTGTPMVAIGVPRLSVFPWLFSRSNRMDFRLTF